MENAPVKDVKLNSQMWSNVKTAASKLDGKQLLKLVSDLYSLSRENQAFLHARFSIGDDALGPYKKTISACMYLDALWGERLFGLRYEIGPICPPRRVL